LTWVIRADGQSRDHEKLMIALVPNSPDRPALDAIVECYDADPTALVQILRDAQGAEGWLPPTMITYVATRLGLPRARVEGVAGFYSFLHLAPVGRYRVLFSDNITDRMAGNQALLDRFCTNLWIERGKVSEDGLVSVDWTSCTGMGDQGPALLVNYRAVTRMTPSRVGEMVGLIRNQTPVRDHQNTVGIDHGQVHIMGNEQNCLEAGHLQD
jgi:[NiFe] hydrogenase diaphorase moiety large subunit